MEVSVGCHNYRDLSNVPLVRIIETNMNIKERKLGKPGQEQNAHGTHIGLLHKFEYVVEVVGIYASWLLSLKVELQYFLWELILIQHKKIAST